MKKDKNTPAGAKSTQGAVPANKMTGRVPAVSKASMTGSSTRQGMSKPK
jgi:hypothetical protein